MSPKLNPKKVFGNQTELLNCHQKWKEIRDNRFNHPDSIGLSIETALIVDEDENFLDVKTIRFDIPIGQLEDKMQILAALVSQTSAFLEQRAQEIHEAIRCEALRLTRREIESLSELSISRPNY